MGLISTRQRTTDTSDIKNPKHIASSAVRQTQQLKVIVARQADARDHRNTLDSKPRSSAKAMRTKNGRVFKTKIGRRTTEHSLKNGNETATASKQNGRSMS